MATGLFARVSRWAARVWSILGIVFVFAFAVAEITGGRPRPTLQECIGLALWPVGVGVGLVVAWFREELGGILTLGFLIAFYIWNLLRSGHWPHGPYFFLVAAPGILFLTAGFLSHRRADRLT